MDLAAGVLVVPVSMLRDRLIDSSPSSIVRCVAASAPWSSAARWIALVSAAVGLVKGIVGVVLVLGANKLAHRLGEQGIYHR